MLTGSSLCLLSIMTASYLIYKERLREITAFSSERCSYLPIIKIAFLLSIKEDKLKV